MLLNTLFFTTQPSSSESILWKSDGSREGTAAVADFTAEGGITPIDNLTVLNHTLYFTADNGTTGNELWQSDGTTAGTHQVLDINPDDASSDPSGLTLMNGVLYFAANDGSRRVVYTVRRGDTLYSIARLLQVTVVDLVGWNGMNGDHSIKPGQTLVAFVRSRS